MTVLVVISYVLGYTFMAGLTHACCYRVWNCTESDEPGPVLASLCWPIILPTLVARSSVLRLFKFVDERRAKATAREAEVKQRIAELDEELREDELRRQAADERRAADRRAVS